MGNTQSASTSFPLEKLPPELQRMVFQAALPPHCLRPKPFEIGSRQADRLRVYKWDANQNEFRRLNEDDVFFTYLLELELEKEYGYTVDLMSPLNLLRVSKTVAATARSICYDDVPMVINIALGYLQFLQTDILDEEEFPTYKDFAHIEHFKALRHFQLDFNWYDRWWNSEFQKPRSENDIGWWRQPKEWLRTVRDLLAANSRIEKLSVRLPCFCSLETAELVAQAEIAMTDLLEPLKQLRVRDSVHFIWQRTPDDESQTLSPGANKMKASHHCTTGMGEDMVQFLEKSLSRLNGEELSPQEQTWKNIKAVPRIPDEDGGKITLEHSSLLWSLHEELPYMHYGLGGEEEPNFDDQAEGVEEDLWKQWNEHLRLKKKKSMPGSFE
ncbi:MAG: hypothetical protein Q9215_006487 [Flavoplaca cf. flavocitrina]